MKRKRESLHAQQLLSPREGRGKKKKEMLSQKIELFRDNGEDKCDIRKGWVGWLESGEET